MDRRATTGAARRRTRGAGGGGFEASWGACGLGKACGASGRHAGRARTPRAGATLVGAGVIVAPVDSSATVST
jgi:hypothetical protein